MTIADPRFAAELVTTRGRVYVFDDVGCLAAFVASESVPSTVVHSLWVHDFLQPDSLLDARTASYLRVDSLRTPMSSHLAALAPGAAWTVRMPVSAASGWGGSNCCERGVVGELVVSLALLAGLMPQTPTGPILVEPGRRGSYAHGRAASGQAGRHDPGAAGNLRRATHRRRRPGDDSGPGKSDLRRPGSARDPDRHGGPGHHSRPHPAQRRAQLHRGPGGDPARGRARLHRQRQSHRSRPSSGSTQRGPPTASSPTTSSRVVAGLRPPRATRSTCSSRTASRSPATGFTGTATASTWSSPARQDLRQRERRATCATASTSCTRTPATIAAIASPATAPGSR